jgi:hypothetical protein
MDHGTAWLLAASFGHVNQDVAGYVASAFVQTTFSRKAIYANGPISIPGHASAALIRSS